MRWKDYVDEQELTKAVSVLKPEHQLFEIRILGADKRNLSGYFTDSKTLLSALDTVDLRGKNIYITLNRLNEALYSRDQHDRFLLGATATSDTEVDRYEWMFIDLDPKRLAGVSSSAEELKAAEELKNKVRDHLHGLGFFDPIEAISGNGYHLLYRIDLPCDQDHVQLINDCLGTVADLFNTDKVKIDTVNYNPSRICKLYGTIAQKGANTDKRPHRMSRLLSLPDEIRINDEKLLKALAGELPKETKPKRTAASAPAQTFNIRDWLARYGMTYKEDVGRDCQIFALDECPFDHSHRNGDSKIFAYTNGAVAFKCHHNSCAGRTWQDVRLKFEPDAYDRKFDDERLENGYQSHKKNKNAPVPFIPLEGDEERPVSVSKGKKKTIRKLKTADALMQKDIPEPKVFVGVGEELPFLVEGTCILSAKPKLGKSWLALEMGLAIANGEDFIGYKTEKCSVLYLDLETSEAIQKKRLKKALKGKAVPKNFYLETETDGLDDGFAAQIEAYLEEDPNIGVVIVDVFEIIRTAAKSIKETEYAHAYRDLTPLNELCLKHHISLILVCHDRKAVDPDDPFSNILGSTGLQGAASQMIVMFRRKKEDPIHISVKGKTIDGLPELNVRLEDAEWHVVEAVDSASQERERALWEYRESDIRKAVLAITEKYPLWKGRCSTLIQDAVELDIGITDSAKMVGGFLHKHQGRFLAEDGIKVQIIDKGTGSKVYQFTRTTISTISHHFQEEEIPFPEWEESSVYAGSGDQFL